MPDATPPGATRPKITLHMVSSLDGFIARKDNTVSWLDTPANSYDRGVSNVAGVYRNPIQ